MRIKTNQTIKVGDKVTFDNDKIEVFKAGITMTTVAYSDGWELPIPTKYLIVLPEAP